MSGCSRNGAAAYRGFEPVALGLGHHGTAEHGRRGVVGVSLEFRRELYEFDVEAAARTRLHDKPIGRGEPADDRRRRRTESARVRNLVATAHVQPRRTDTRRLQAALDGAHDEVCGVSGTCPAPSPSTSTDQTGFGCLQDDLVIQAQGQAEAVEARAKVRARRGDHRMWQSVRRAASVSPAQSFR